MDRIAWSGRVVSVQPRIRLGRSFDERYHSYLGYCLRIDGLIGGEVREFTVGIGQAAERKHRFQVGDEAAGQAAPVADPRLEPVELYRTARLKVLRPYEGEVPPPPPWHGVPVELDEYRGRGHRRLSARTYAARCSTCIWGCRMPAVITVDQWKPEIKQYRYETFCYGPKSCPLYSPGPTRKVPGRHGMVWEEEDWVDEDHTAHREPDE